MVNMTTKQMHAHLMQCGCAFTKNEFKQWECTFDGEVIARHRELGRLVWIAASELGED